MGKNNYNVDWGTIKAAYVTSDKSCYVLARDFQISRSTIAQKCTKEGWVQERLDHRAAVVSQTKALAIEESSEYKKEIYAIAYDMAGRLKKLIKGRSMQKLIALGLKPRDITGAIKDLSDILNVRSADDLAEQRARINKLEREAEEAEATKEVRVIMTGVEEYSK